MEDELVQLYSEELLDYSERRPPPEMDRPADILVEGTNPYCGDKACLSLWLHDDHVGRVQQLSWKSSGCVVSQAGAALCADLVTGRTAGEIAKLSLNDFQTAFGKRIIQRYRCALLCLWLVQEGFRRKSIEPEKQEWRGISVETRF